MRLCFYFHVYLYMFLIYVFFCVSLQGEHHSHNGGEDVTSRQHDWCGRHGPPWTHDWRIIHREPEETLRPQWDLCKSSGNNAVVTITPNKLFGFCVCEVVVFSPPLRPPSLVWKWKCPETSHDSIVPVSLKTYFSCYIGGSDTETTVTRQSVNHITKEWQ